MIAPRNYLPLLEDQHGEVRALEPDWLLAALERAAVKAGFMEWWLGDHVISSVCSYLSGFYTSNVVGLGRLEAVVRQALRDVGYVEIARHFEADPPASYVSLLKCAQSLRVFDPVDFYQILTTHVEAFQRSGLATFQFQDLGACLSFINNEAKGENLLRGREIVEVIRKRISSLEWEREVTCSIC